MRNPALGRRLRFNALTDLCLSLWLLLHSLHPFRRKAGFKLDDDDDDVGVVFNQILGDP